MRLILWCVTGVLLAGATGMGGWLLAERQGQTALAQEQARHAEQVQELEQQGRDKDEQLAARNEQLRKKDTQLVARNTRLARWKDGLRSDLAHLRPVPLPGHVEWAYPKARTLAQVGGEEPAGFSVGLVLTEQRFLRDEVDATDDDFYTVANYYREKVVNVLKRTGKQDMDKGDARRSWLQPIVPGSARTISIGAREPAPVGLYAFQSVRTEPAPASPTVIFGLGGGGVRLTIVVTQQAEKGKTVIVRTRDTWSVAER